MRQAIVTLKKGEGRLLKSGGAWIFDNEIDSIMGEFENGDIVIVHDFDGYGMGRGFINMNSKIRIRMMTRKQDQEIVKKCLNISVGISPTFSLWNSASQINHGRPPKSNAT